MARVAKPNPLTGEVVSEPRTEKAKYTPEFPTDGRELCQLWGMGADAMHTETVKVAVYTPGTESTSLVTSMPVGNYSMEEIAGEYGPGRYLIKPGPGQYRGKTATLQISEQYARKCGWNELPPLPPRQAAPSDRFIMDRMAQPQVQGNDIPLLVELAVSKALAMNNGRQTEPVRDPVAPIMSGFELALTMMEKARGVINPVQTIEKEPATVADVLMTYGGDILGVLRQGLAALATPAQPPAPPKVVNQEPATDTAQKPQEQPLELPNLTKEEVGAINPILGVLNEFGGRLVGFIRSPIPAETLGAQLAGMIGPDLEQSALALADVVERHGPNVLGIKHRELASEKGAAIVKAAAEAIRADKAE